MDLIPKPDQVASAANNLARKMLYGGLADLRPMPRTLIDDGLLREVYHYWPNDWSDDWPNDGTRARTRDTGDPVLLVAPLAAPALCFDLRRGCSFVEHLLSQGRPTYLVEYGEVSFANRTLGMEHWIDEVIPAAIREVSAHAGGRPVHLVGWSLGGIFALLTTADQPDLPIGSLTVLGSPLDVTQVPLLAPSHPLLNITDGPVSTQIHRLLGGAAKPLVRRAFQLSSLNRLAKPITLMTRLDDAEFLAQVEAVDRFNANMIAYPGRAFGQLYHRMYKGNQLATGVLRMAHREISLADLRVPLLVICGAGDAIAPAPSVRALVDLVPHVRQLRFETVPGGHLGMLTGRAARRTTWPIIDEFLLECASVVLTRPAGKKPAKRAARPRSATSGVRRPGAATIGSNPNRRYGSASSRSLTAKKA